MADTTFEEFVDQLREMDPDYLVDVLRISSEELVDTFPDHVESFYNSEWGEAEFGSGYSIIEIGEDNK